ncbi:molecular chaperone [Morganella morganii]
MNQQTDTAKHSFRSGLILWCITAMMAGGGTSGAVASDGGISLSQTRVIFEGDRRSEKVMVTNQSGLVYLISSRVLSTPEQKSGGQESLPFMMTPPLFRLESDARNAVLVVRNDTSVLPSDRESVFYLSFLAIPAVSKPAGSSAGDVMQPRVSVGIRSVIKLFYRPPGLGTSAAEAAGKLNFTMKDGVLYAENPTPYYLTLASLQADGRGVDVRQQDPMLPPYGSRDYRIRGSAGTVSWSVIDDYGGVSKTYSQRVR